MTFIKINNFYGPYDELLVFCFVFMFSAKIASKRVPSNPKIHTNIIPKRNESFDDDVTQSNLPTPNLQHPHLHRRQSSDIEVIHEDSQSQLDTACDVSTALGVISGRGVQEMVDSLRQSICSSSVESDAGLKH